jgi:hypothetical protein
MKRTIALAILALGMSLGFISHASAQATSVRVTVPFDFAVEGNILPQGTYQIGTSGGFLGFKNASQHASLFAQGLPGAVSKDGRSVLVFDKVQGKYFLRKIVTFSGPLSVDFQRSKQDSKTRESAELRSIYAETSSR